MPRAAKVRGSATTLPYDRRSSETLPDNDTSCPPPDPTSSKKETKGSKSGKGEYNKPLLVSLIIAPSKPDWGPIAHDLNKSTQQCFDVWRKTILPSLLAGKPWAGSNNAWGGDEKILLLIKVIGQLKINWEDIAAHFPGRSKSQVTDIWRKVVFPRLKRGDTIE